MPEPLPTTQPSSTKQNQVNVIDPKAKPNPPFSKDKKFSIVKGPFVVRFD